MDTIDNSLKNISLIYRFVEREITEEKDKLGLTPGQSILLIGILRNPGLTQVDLAQKIRMDTSVVSRQLHTLEKEGLVTKDINEKDRRFFIINITDKGKNLAQKSLNTQNKIWEKITTGLDNRDKRDLNQTLYTILENTYEA